MLEHSSALPNLSHAEQEGNLPSHLILAVRHLEQADIGRLTRNGGVWNAFGFSIVRHEVEVCFLGPIAHMLSTASQWIERKALASGLRWLSMSGQFKYELM